jgi:PAS domain S-box-containing protein
MAPVIDKDKLLAELSDGIVVCTKEGDIVYSNPAFARILEQSHDKIKTKNLAKDLVERSIEWKAMVSLLEQGGLVEDYEIKFRKSDGSTICASVSSALLRDTAGSLIGVAIALRDITTRKSLEHELRDKAFKIDILNKIARISTVDSGIRIHALANIGYELKKLVNFDMITVGITEHNGRHVDVILPDPEKPNTTNSLGTVPFEGSVVEGLKFGTTAIIVGKDAGRKPYTELQIVDASRYMSMLCVALTSRGQTIGSLNIYSSKQNEYTLETVETLQMVADQVAGLVDNMVLMSYLEKKVKLQETLLRSGVELQKAINTQQIYAAIASNLRESIAYTDLSIYLVDWPKRLIYPVYAVGSYTDEVMANPGTVDEGVVGVVAKSGNAEFMDDVDSDPRSAAIPGEPLEHNSMLAIPLASPDGVMGVLELYRPRGHVFTNSDLEAGKLFAQQASVALSNAKLVSKLQDANKEIELLNDLMFHDINNFNFATLNYIQEIAHLKEIPPEHRVYLEKSLHLIRQTAELIENVKKLTKIGVLNSEDFVPIDLSLVLRKTVSGLENSFPGKALSVKMNVPESSFVLANKLVEELFVNLLTNSVKYDPHEEVEMELDCEKVLEDNRAFWKICICDHGIGIADDKKPILFQKYVRLKPDPKTQGTGLGLSICRALADKFGGRIWVEDRVPGRSELGAKFCVVLPAAKGVRS